MTMTINFNHDNWVFEGQDPDADIVTFAAGASNVGARFDTIGIRGALVGRIIATKCIIGNGGTVSGLQGVLNTTGTSGTLQLAAGGTVTGLEVAARDLTGTVLDFSAGSANFLCGSVLGIWTVVSMTSGDILGLALLGSIVILASSNTGGIARIGGVGELANSAGGGLTLIDEVVRGSDTQKTRKHITNRRKIDTTTTPWRERVYDDNGTSVIQNADLKDTAGADITNANKPEGVIIGERLP
jgi:hypothetical protein